MLTLFELAAALLVLSAVFGWINTRFFRLPQTIGLVTMALFASLALIGFDHLFPGSPLREFVTGTLAQIDFFDVVMHGMLAFLLFAGALHVDFAELSHERWPVGVLATVGVVLSTALVGAGFWLLARFVGIEMPFAWALVFGALVSPTDPVAVLSLLKSVRVPETLEVKIAGESLFNDGVGVVVFTALLAVAVGGGGGPGVLHVGEIFVVEALGGVALGVAAGAIAVRAMQSIDNYPVEVLISLALVTGLYALAIRIGTSGPLAVVAAGLLVGNRGAATAMSDLTQRYLFGFWELVDELLNSVLFLLIGLEVLVIAVDRSLLGFGLAAIPLVLVARLCSVSAPMLVAPLRRTFTRGSLPVLTWGGLRGGISVALALSLPESPYREPVLLATYCVVIFSVVIQGLTIPVLIRRIGFE
ncbi:cation:proton antiporter [Propylenella binzhouense]|uniref:Sodium:proton antiporter n=1 Tax=Propylenella binzhouense TaxID=2555902 RepID=A0A964WV57_9HYPH|nr:sodium:proton antiporter [Propylenella binzhouense]MYZ49698.1 sodium:proton antiporter [Propylenella binzhouense]